MTSTTEIPVVFACTTAALPLPDGTIVTVRLGQHWPADDPVVRQHPGAFASDPRFGMRWTGEVPAYMKVPPGEPIPTEMLGGAPAVAPRRGARRDG